jgi:hypothetical protein
MTILGRAARGPLANSLGAAEFRLAGGLRLFHLNAERLAAWSTKRDGPSHMQAGRGWLLPARGNYLGRNSE